MGAYDSAFDDCPLDAPLYQLNGVKKPREGVRGRRYVTRALYLSALRCENSFRVIA